MIFEKLTEARIRFQNLQKKQSGQNKYAGYSYYELSDILPEINKLAKELKFICLASFDDKASLRIVDLEDASEVTFYSPMSEASLKGCHAVQNLGAVQTYLKRYLYQNAFEIVEADALNATHNPEPISKSAPKKEEPIQVECGLLAEQYGLNDAEKKALWLESGKNYGKLKELIVVHGERKQANQDADIY